MRLIAAIYLFLKDLEKELGPLFYYGLLPIILGVGFLAVAFVVKPLPVLAAILTGWCLFKILA